MIDSIIFDLDGTLWDSTREILRCWQSELPNITQSDLVSCMGLTPEGIAKNLNVPIETVYDVQEKEIPWLSKYTVSPYIGVTLMLQYLYNRYPMFIVSNCQSGYIECFLQTNHLEKYFTDWKCSGGKDKATNVKDLIKKFKINPLLVGDTETDYEAARIAGIPFIWAAYGFGKVNTENVIYKPMDLMLKVDNVQN